MSTVVLDPGHGGATAVGGSSPNNSTSVSGRLEKDLTLVVARHAQAALAARGHTVLLTRTGDVNLALAARARVAREAQAAAFISIHFNGFGDPTVQGTETWVHLEASARSRVLAECVQRAVLQATGYQDRGVQARRLGVLTPGSHTPQTAACLAELSFITTTADDRRLADPAYLQALGEAVAAGVAAFLARPMPVATPAAAASRAATGADTVLADVRQAIAALAKQGTPAKFEGPVTSDGDGNSHLQGLAGHKDVFLLTQSDRSEQSGRILVVDRRPTQRKLVAEFRLPPFATTGPALYHAGGCQVLGDVLAVPSESGQNVSVVAFFDVSDPLNIRELHPSLRIERTTRDAAAAGLAAITRNGRFVWLVAVYDSGTVDFYESSDLPGGAPFVPLFSFKVEEKHHQALLLLTDTTNTVFAVGLNRGFLGRNDLVLYEVDLVTHTMATDPDRRSYSPDGGSMRWGAGVEIAGAQTVHMHCTSRNYGKRCTISAFAPGAAATRAVATKPSGGRTRTATTKKSAAGKASARRTATKKAASKKTTATKPATTRARKGSSASRGRTK